MVHGFGPNGQRAEAEYSTSFVDLTYDPMGNYLQRESAANYALGYYVLDTAQYDAYGTCTADIRTSTGAAMSHIEPIGYGGQWGNYYDYETGLLSLGHRYYDPATGRFINRDPIGYDGGINLYGYCGNNPINGVDTAGMRNLDSQDLAMFTKLRSAAGSGNPLLTLNGVEPLIEGCISELTTAIGQSNGTSEATDPARLRTAWFAIAHLGDPSYGAADTLDETSGFFGMVKGSRCNVFVADSYGAVVGYGGLHGVPLYGNWFARHPAGANVLGDASQSVPHFNVISKPGVGDIAGFEELGARPTDLVHGHSAIYLGNGVLIYAGSKMVKLGDVASNQTGHNPVVYRRYSAW